MRAEDLEYRRGTFEYDTLDDSEFTRMPRIVWRNKSHCEFAPTKIRKPPRNDEETLAGRYSRYSAQSSVLSQRVSEPRAPRQPTKKDARLHEIPTNFIVYQWDPDEKPIFFRGNVFDANSFGKWIFDWTAFSYGGERSPIALIASDLWLVLIDLTTKLKLSEKLLQTSTDRTSKDVRDADMVSDFIASGEGLMEKLQLFLGKCEEPVEEALNYETELGGLLVNIMFDRSNRLGQTERLIQHIRLWNFRWDANCADVI